MATTLAQSNGIEFVQLSKEDARQHIRQLMDIERSVHFGHVIICGVYPQGKTADFDRKDFLHIAASNNGIFVGESYGQPADQLVNLPRRVGKLADEESLYYFAQTTVLRKWRGHGIGSELFRLKAQAANALGYEKAIAFAEDWNKPILRIFQSLKPEIVDKFRINGIGRKYYVFSFDLTTV